MEDQCGEKKDEDKDSVVSDRCWEEIYKGDSRKWLLRDGSTKKSENVVSTMKDTYLYPHHEDQVIGNFVLN